MAVGAVYEGAFLLDSTKYPQSQTASTGIFPPFLRPDLAESDVRQYSRMMPGGHLITSLALSGAAYGSSGSTEVAAGCFLGGFLIDVDHYLDYLVFEGQWRKPSPLRFLSYYFRNSPRRLVLPLHSAELMTALLLI